jgi:hypothetical protein
MKKYTLLLITIMFALSVTSCEEVIDVDLDTAQPRLVIDAALQWQKGTSGATQKIKLSTTTGYFNQNVPKVSGATVFVTNEAAVVFDFIETVPNSGEYICTNFIPVLNSTYQLTVIQDGVTYVATETLKPVPNIDRIEQRNDGGFTGEDIEIKFFYTDNGATDDFYLFRAKLSSYQIPEYGVSSDEFYQGNQIFGLYSNEDFKSGDELAITLNGISEGYFNYLRVLLSIAGSANGSPFQSPPATVRGNIVNTVDDKNYVLGYFSLSETAHIDYIIE